MMGPSIRSAALTLTHKMAKHGGSELHMVWVEGAIAPKPPKRFGKKHSRSSAVSARRSPVQDG
jgi:hypothetical protein